MQLHAVGSIVLHDKARGLLTDWPEREAWRHQGSDVGQIIWL